MLIITYITKNYTKFHANPQKVKILVSLIKALLNFSSDIFSEYVLEELETFECSKEAQIVKKLSSYATLVKILVQELWGFGKINKVMWLALRIIKILDFLGADTQNLSEMFVEVWAGRSDEFSEFLNFLLKSKARGVLDGWVASKFLFKISESFLPTSNGPTKYEALLMQILLNWNLDESVKLLTLAQDKFYLVWIKRALESQALKFSD